MTLIPAHIEFFRRLWRITFINIQYHLLYNLLLLVHLRINTDVSPLSCTKLGTSKCRTSKYKACSWGYLSAGVERPMSWANSEIRWTKNIWGSDARSGPRSETCRASRTETAPSWTDYWHWWDVEGCSAASTLDFVLGRKWQVPPRERRSSTIGNSVKENGITHYLARKMLKIRTRMAENISWMAKGLYFNLRWHTYLHW